MEKFLCKKNVKVDNSINFGIYYLFKDEILQPHFGERNEVHTSN
jgi:hypothetical protein